MKEDSLKVNVKEDKLEDFFLIVYFYVDEIYQQLQHWVRRPGPKPDFSDSEVIALNLIGQMVSDSENAWHRFVRKNYLHLFPDLTSRSRYHRRCKNLQQLTELMRLVMIQLIGAHEEPWHILDSIPVPVCVYVRAGRNDRFCTEFQVDNDLLYGRCASKDQKVYGFKLHLMVTIQGTPVHYVLAPAAYHDVDLAPEVLETYRPYISLGTDKGYVGLNKKLQCPEAYQLIIPPRKNQKMKLSKEEKLFLKKYRRIVETTGSILVEQFNLQYTRARSKWGLTGRIISKLTSLTMAILLNHLAGEPLLHVKELIF